MTISRGDRALRLSHNEARRLREAAQVLAEALPGTGEKTCMSEVQGFCCDFSREFGVDATANPFWESLPAVLDRMEHLQESVAR